MASPRFQLTSTKTALALLVPESLRPEINALRRVHDKSFGVWEAHINIIYPFVEPSQLSSALSLIQSVLGEDQEDEEQDVGALAVDLNEVGVFQHRRNATVFLKPSPESEKQICGFRRLLVNALGCDEADGTYDGIFRPHLSLGQAKMAGDSVSLLVEQVEALVGLQWRAVKLVVLQRRETGGMQVVGEVPFCRGNEIGAEVRLSDRTRSHSRTAVGWRGCYRFALDTGWSQISDSDADPPEKTEGQRKTETETRVDVLTYNLMADNRAPPFSTRLPLITQAISSALTAADSGLQILCLQEINDEMLPLLLNSPFIRTTFPFATHCPTSFLPSHRNLLTLASHPFQHFTLRFAERHKTALVVTFLGCEYEVILANVHLTSALSNHAVAVKKTQMDTLTKFLLATDTETDEKDNENRRSIIVAGDFNLTTSSQTLETAVSENLIKVETAQLVETVIDAEIWEDSFTGASDGDKQGEGGEEMFDGEQGATFDRLTNPLAGLSEVVVDNRPQRYDRVIYMRGENGKSEIRSEHWMRFGMPDQDGLAGCGSDHYGVCATLAITNQEPSISETLVSKTQQHDPVKNNNEEEIEIIEDSTDLSPLLSPYLPTEEDREQRHQALAVLEQTLTSHELIKDLLFAPLGSYAMDTYFADSDVDLLVIGSVPPGVFFDVATRQLRDDDGAENREVKGVHFVNSLVSIMEAVVMGVKFDLQYCQAGEILERYLPVKDTTELSTLLLDNSLISTLSPSSLRPLNTYRDTQYLIRTNPSLESFQTAYRYLALFLKNRGLYSAKFSYLGGIHLCLMLNRVIKLTSNQLCTSNGTNTNTETNVSNTGEQEGQKREISPATLIRTFMTYYASFNWAHSPISDPNLAAHNSLILTQSRSARDALFIPSIHIPTARRNVAASCTRLSGSTLSEEFQHASARLLIGDWGSNLQSPEHNSQEFLKAYGAYILVVIDVWDMSPREVVGCLESRIPRLLVSLGRVHGVEARVWPGRFCSRTECEEGEKAKGKGKGSPEDLKAHYVVGIRGGKGLDVQEKNLFTSKILTTVREFEGSVRTAREFSDSAANAWLSVELTTRKKLDALDLLLDRRALDTVADGPEPQPESETSKVEGKSPLAVGAGTGAGAGKRPKATSLRPAHDIIARIHWDPLLSPDDFFIGYEDRFVGVKEMELRKWKSEQTDEEFIPRHRIVWIRRKDGEGEQEGEKVWDRRRKVDLLFGSGVGGG